MSSCITLVSKRALCSPKRLLEVEEELGFSRTLFMRVLSRSLGLLLLLLFRLRVCSGEMSELCDLLLSFCCSLVVRLLPNVFPLEYLSLLLLLSVLLSFWIFQFLFRPPLQSAVLCELCSPQLWHVYLHSCLLLMCLPLERSQSLSFL